MRRADGPRARAGSALGVLGLCLAAPGACSDSGEATGTAQRSAISVDESVLVELARQRGISREQALALTAEDALLARQLVAQAPDVGRWIERTVLARQLLGSLAQEAIAAGPPTDAEVTRITDERFWELARPRMVQVVHAVVLSKAEDPAARSLAERIVSATIQAKTPAEFRAAAQGVEAGGLSVKVESLPPLAPDGRAVDPNKPPPAGPPVQQFDVVFSAAAHRLQQPGEMSPVVKTPFGYHVMYLVSVIEAQQPTLDERRALLHDEIMTQRANVLSAALLDRQRRELAPEKERSALASMAALEVGR